MCAEPWTCCNDSELLPDNFTCPDCGQTKASYTLRFQKTRVFQISRKGRSLELQLVDAEGNPVGGEDYWVQFPNEKTVEGTLDKDGYAKIKVPVAGTCKVKLVCPRLR